MIEKVGHIKNPLTVISVFAGIAEISGTIVLPFIAPENQATYIWFLMLFPPFLVGIFFATLNWNHKTLYAPSDYQNEDNFVNHIGKSTSHEQVKKLQEEAEEVIADIPIVAKPAQNDESADPDITQPAPSSEAPMPSTKAGGEEVGDSAPASKQTNRGAADHISLMSRASAAGEAHFMPLESSPYLFAYHDYEINRLKADIKHIETRAVKTLKEMTGLPFETNAKVHTKNGRSVLFDAAATSKNHLYAMEVKVFNSHFSISRLTKTLRDCQELTEDGNISPHNFTLYLVIVSDAKGAVREAFHRRILQQIQKYDFNVQVHMMTAEDLTPET